METIDASVIEFDIEGRKIVASMVEFYKNKDLDLAAHIEAHPIEKCSEGGIEAENVVEEEVEEEM